MHTQSNTTNIIFTWVHNTNIHKKYVRKLSTNLTLYSHERLVIFILAYYCSTTCSKAVREIIEEFQCLIKSSKFCSINFWYKTFAVWYQIPVLELYMYMKVNDSRSMLSRKMFRVSRSRNPLDKNSRSLDRLLETRFALLDTQEFCEKREISMQTFTRNLATRNLDASIHENSRSAILRVKFFAYVNNLQLLVEVVCCLQCQKKCSGTKFIL
jgi:hypothetical protein